MKIKGIIPYLVAGAMLMSACGNTVETDKSVDEAADVVIKTQEATRLTNFYIRNGNEVTKYTLMSDLRIEESLASADEISKYQLDTLDEGRLLVWQDTFSEEKLDENVWKIDEGQKNITIKDGILLLQSNGESTVKVAMTTLGSKQFNQGKLEIRTKFSNVTGQKANLSAAASWPDPRPTRAGKMDIVNQLSEEGYCYKVTSIYELEDYTANYASSPRYEPHAYENNLNEYTIHSFSIDWEQNQLSSFVDENNYGTFSLENKTYWLQFGKADMSCNPYHLPHYFTLGFEGNNGAKMEIDWIRAYAPKEITNPEELVPTKIGVDFVSNVEKQTKIPLSALEYEGEAEVPIYMGAIYLPKTVVDQSCRFSVSDEAIASIDEATGTLTPHKSGLVTITVTDILTGITGSRDINISLK